MSRQMSDAVILEALGEHLGKLRKELLGRIEKELATDPNAVFKSVLLSKLNADKLALERYANNFMHRRAAIVAQKSGTVARHIREVAGHE